MRISDWSSDVCSSDLYQHPDRIAGTDGQRGLDVELAADDLLPGLVERILPAVADGAGDIVIGVRAHLGADTEQGRERGCAGDAAPMLVDPDFKARITRRVAGRLPVEDDRADRKSTRMDSSHSCAYSMPSFA